MTINHATYKCSMESMRDYYDTQSTLLPFHLRDTSRAKCACVMSTRSLCLSSPSTDTPAPHCPPLADVKMLGTVYVCLFWCVVRLCAYVCVCVSTAIVRLDRIPLARMRVCHRLLSLSVFPWCLCGGGGLNVYITRRTSSAYIVHVYSIVCMRV